MSPRQRENHAALREAAVVTRAPGGLLCRPSFLPLQPGLFILKCVPSSTRIWEHTLIGISPLVSQFINSKKLHEVIPSLRSLLVRQLVTH